MPASEFTHFAGPWARLNDVMGGVPLLHPDFVQELLRHFGTGKERLAILGSDDNPVAMGVINHIGPFEWETFQPPQSPVGLWLQRTDIPSLAVITSLLQSLPGMPLAIGVSNQDPAMIPRQADQARCETVDHIVTARVLVDRPFEDYWKGRDGKLRQEMRRRQKRLETLGWKARLERIDHPDQIEEAIADFGRLESVGWKGRSGTAIAADNIQGDFYRSVLEVFSARGKGRIYRLLFDAKIAAMQLCIEDNGILVLLKTTYDEEFGQHAPGILMQYEIFREVFADGDIRRIEFYGRTGEPQAKWCDNQVRTLYHANYYRWASLPKLRRAWLAARQRARA